MPNSPLKVVVFYGSVRKQRQGIKAARFIVNESHKRGHQVSLVDPLEYQFPLLDKMYREYSKGEAPAVLERLAQLVIAADAYIIVSGEYNHTAPPALLNLLDHFLKEYFWKTSAIVSYSAGGFGGVRAAVALRPVLAELGMSSIPSVLPISHVHDAFDDADQPKDQKLLERSKKFLDELEWYAEALRAARTRDETQNDPQRSQCEQLESKENA